MWFIEKLYAFDRKRIGEFPAYGKRMISVNEFI